MIILFNDINIWNKLADFFLRKIPWSGTIILKGHLIDSQFLHWVKDIGNQKLLGRVELSCPIWEKIDYVYPSHIKAAGFPSRQSLKRTLLMFSKVVDDITVVEMKIAEIEKYWCSNSKCCSVNLKFLTKERPGGQIPFTCFDCNKEFYTPDKDGDNPLRGNAWLTRRYRREEIKKIPADQQTVIAVAGERWLI